MKKLLILAFAVILLVSAVGCGSGYRSSYSAVGFIHSSGSDAAFMKFHSFNGTMVFKLKCESDDGAKIAYSLTLETGTANIYYDSDGTKTELISISAGDTINTSGGELSKGTVYLIVETSEICQNGEFRFEITQN